ncbi:MAG: hypothetical protein CR986_08515 [Ignavibacteriae bacterium]|nr:MAG: hypothetical protein CR986_08515 [Ignavibacteriota bacterium]
MIENIKANWSGNTRTDERYYYVKDHLGTPRLVLDEYTNISSGKDYYAFGKTLREINNGTEQKYDYTSKELDKETGLHYYGARYYDTDGSFWYSVDPLADKYPGWSPYNYTLCNPLNRFDPDGKSSFVFQTEIRVMAKFMTAALNVGFAIDHKGNYGMFYGASLGGGAGAGIVAGLFNPAFFPTSSSYKNIGGLGFNVGEFFYRGRKGASGEVNLLGSNDLGMTLGILPKTSIGYGGGVYADISAFDWLAESNITYEFILNYILDIIAVQLSLQNDKIYTRDETVQYLQSVLQEYNQSESSENTSGREPMLDASGESMFP